MPEPLSDPAGTQAFWFDLAWCEWWHADCDDVGNEEGFQHFQRIDTDPVRITLGTVDSDDDPI